MPSYLIRYYVHRKHTLRMCSQDPGPFLALCQKHNVLGISNFPSSFIRPIVGTVLDYGIIKVSYFILVFSLTPPLSRASEYAKYIQTIVPAVFHPSHSWNKAF